MTEAMEEIRQARPRRFRPYPEYRDSGVEWLGAIPAAWAVDRLKHLAAVQLSSVDKKKEEGEALVHLCNYVDVYYNDEIRPEIEFMEATASEEEIRRFSLAEGDVLITKDSESWDDIAVPAYVGPGLDGIVCGYHLAHIRPDRSRLLGSYLGRAFSAAGVRDQFRAAATGITRFGLSKRWIDGASFPVPSVAEQRAIASFLDRETAMIDGLVAKKERLIELLQEKRTALITRAVTQGLDPNAPMKDSGVEWLGKIPAHWNVKKLKSVSKVQTGITLGKTYESRHLVRRPYLRVANVQDGYLDLEDVAEIEIPLEGARRYELQAGDVLMTEGGDFDKLGRGYVWEDQISECLHQNHIFAVRPNQSDVHPRFLSALLRSGYGRAYFTATSKQSTNLASTNSTKLGDFPLPLPVTEEQEGILRWTSEETGTIDRMMELATAGIDRLREFRTALISAAVTGKIDVREEQP